MECGSTFLREFAMEIITIVVQQDPYNLFIEENENNNVLAIPITLTKQAGTTPIVTPSGPTTFCQPGSVTLTSSFASNYLWSNGATTKSITVTSPGVIPLQPTWEPTARPLLHRLT